MKKISIYLFFVCVASVAHAQVKMPSQEPEKKAPVKQTITETKPVNTGPVFTLKIMSNVSCRFYVDGEYKSTITGENIERVNLKQGEYMFKAVSTDNNADVYKKLVTVTKEQIGTEKFYEIDLQTISAERERKETAVYANEKAASQKAIAEELAAEKAATDKIVREQELAEKEAQVKDILEVAENIKHFEGKIVSTYEFENPPVLFRRYYKPGSVVSYYKKNKYRTESVSPGISNTTMIYDYEKMESLTIMELLTVLGQTTKTATLQKINKEPSLVTTIDYYNEYKTIAGYNCQKALHKTSGAENKYANTEYTCYVNRDFTTAGVGFSESNIVPFLLLDYNMPISSMSFNSYTTSISEEPVDDSLFNLTPPSGYTFTDTR